MGYHAPPDKDAAYFPLFEPKITHTDADGDRWRTYLRKRKADASFRVPTALTPLLVDGQLAAGLFYRGSQTKVPVVRPRVRISMGTFELLVERLARALSPLAFAMQSEDDIRNVIAQLGWTLPTVPPSLSGLGEGLVQLNTSLAELTVALRSAELADSDSSDVDTALESLALDLALIVAQLHELPGHLAAELPADYIAATHIDEEIEGRIFDWLLSVELVRSSAVSIACSVWRE